MNLAASFLDSMSARARRASALVAFLSLGVGGRVVRAQEPASAPAEAAVAEAAWPSDLGAEPQTMVRLKGADQSVLRLGPGDEFAMAGVYPSGTVFRVIAKSGPWYHVAHGADEVGWVHESLCETYQDLSGLEFRSNPRLYSRAGSFLLTGRAGGYAFDRKSNSLAVGGSIGYYLLDFLEVEGGVGWTHVRRPAEIVESLFGLSLESEDFQLLYYQIGGRLEVMPGRRMVPYVAAGAGSTLLQGRSESTTSFGAGTLLFIGKRSAMRWEARDLRFHSGTARARRQNNNIEFSFGTSILL